MGFIYGRQVEDNDKFKDGHIVVTSLVQQLTDSEAITEHSTYSLTNHLNLIDFFDFVINERLKVDGHRQCVHILSVPLYYTDKVPHEYLAKLEALKNFKERKID